MVVQNVSEVATNLVDSGRKPLTGINRLVAESQE